MGAGRIGMLTRLVDADQLGADRSDRAADCGERPVVAARDEGDAGGARIDVPVPRSERFDAERVALAAARMREGLQAFFQRRPPNFTGA